MICRQAALPGEKKSSYKICGLDDHIRLIQITETCASNKKKNRNKRTKKKSDPGRLGSDEYLISIPDSHGISKRATEIWVRDKPVATPPPPCFQANVQCCYRCVGEVVFRVTENRPLEGSFGFS